MPRTDKNDAIVVSALCARANFGQLLRWVEDERRLVVIGKGSMPKAILLSIGEYVRLATRRCQAFCVNGVSVDLKFSCVPAGAARREL